MPVKFGTVMIVDVYAFDVQTENFGNFWPLFAAHEYLWRVFVVKRAGTLGLKVFQHRLQLINRFDVLHDHVVWTQRTIAFLHGQDVPQPCVHLLLAVVQ